MTILSCSDTKNPTFKDLFEGNPSIEGKPEYLSSPYVTAGDRVYMVGHQDGTFPDLGWHIKGEMGGIWDHPIKLMDGFTVSLTDSINSVSLDNASSFVNYPFGNMHNFQVDSLGLEVERWQFVPDGKEAVVIQFNLKNTLNETKKIGLKFIADTDLRPTWLGEQTNMQDGADHGIFDSELDAWIIRDNANPWFSILGSDQPSIYDEKITHFREGKGMTATIDYLFEIPKNESKTITFIIAGSQISEPDARATFTTTKGTFMHDLESKISRYKELSQRSKLTVPDKDIELAFEWLKYNCDWLVRNVPEIGSGIGAGIPDYPWWFGVDSEYALQGYMAIGQSEPVYNTIALLDSVSNALNGNGRIIHEMSTNGAVFNPGNINETPQYASLIWKIYQWNGDMDFLRKYFPTVKNGLNWLMTEKDVDGNLFPDGFGMMEIHGMDSEMIDVAAYTQKAFADASTMALALNDTVLAGDYYKIAKNLKERINTEFWSEEFGSYADFIGTDEQALKLIEDAIVRADTLNKPWAVMELKQTREAIKNNPSTKSRPFVLHHNWVVNTPMEVGIADHDKAIRALNSAEKYVNPYGVFVTGIDRDASAGSDDGSFKGSKIFSYTGAVMTLPTGVQIVAENNYNRPDNALNYLKRMTRTFSYALPGSIYEVSPDYGMITQAWNIYGYGVPIVEQFFGIKPDAANKKITIKPQMPSSWGEASLENVVIGDNEISIYFSEKNGKQIIRIEQSNSDWELFLALPKSENSELKGRKGAFTHCEVSGEPIHKVTSKATIFEVEYRR